MNGPAKVSTTLVHALADVMGQDVTDTDFCLYDSIDPDALNRLFANRPGGHVAFGVNGYAVTVYGDGRVVITEPPSTPESPVSSAPR